MYNECRLVTLHFEISQLPVSTRSANSDTEVCKHTSIRSPSLDPPVFRGVKHYSGSRVQCIIGSCNGCDSSSAGLESARRGFCSTHLFKNVCVDRADGAKSYQENIDSLLAV